uniref:Uncharacterized protein n=1 Tax=Helicotheca tamesis TaxID=374047 RepID=A0A6U0FMW0_9STRA|mmetsp:Transcript_15694/g.21517  ORF Transcript_15694/g.21517 Transcript_15694/m.21517 type:complete len:201 (+) Transcript_15694:359-961(+)
MFIRSAAADTPQGRAIQNINTRWGADFRKWNGMETIGIPVCKKKYAPFDIKVVRNENGIPKVTVERLYGCKCHSHLRKKLIERHGERKGWEPFGQWSLRKANAMAKRETERLNAEYRQEAELSDSSSGESSNSSFSSEDERFPSWKTICSNGLCTWKMRGKFDDIFSEIHNKDEINGGSNGSFGYSSAEDRYIKNSRGRR